MLLSEAEIAALTRKQRHPAQRKVLNAMGITHKVRPDGSLAVSLAHVKHLLGDVATAKVVKEDEPDWSAMQCVPAR